MGKVIVVVDYHKGNLSSVERGLVRAGAAVRVTDDPAAIAGADALVLPGVGSFYDAMEYMRESGQARAVCEAVRRGVPFLGICLGLQLLYDRGCEGVPRDESCDGLRQEALRAVDEGNGCGCAAAEGRESAAAGANREELPQGLSHAADVTPGNREAASQGCWTEGLGILRGQVVRMESDTLKVPHMGWNQVVPTAAGAACPLLAGVPRGANMYFTHSYIVDPAAACAADVVATTSYAGDFPCMVQRKNVFGCQFHPEKSSRAGQVILRNFVALVNEGVPSAVCPDAEAARVGAVPHEGETACVDAKRGEGAGTKAAGSSASREIADGCAQAASVAAAERGAR